MPIKRKSDGSASEHREPELASPNSTELPEDNLPEDVLEHETDESENNEVENNEQGPANVHVTPAANPGDPQLSGPKGKNVFCV